MGEKTVHGPAILRFDPIVPGEGAVGLDGSDFNSWNGNKFTTNVAWYSGNFNVDPVIDGSDFNVWNGNKFTSSDGSSAVPEPTAVCGLLVALCGPAVRPLRPVR